MTPLEEIQNKISQLNMWTKAYDEGHPIVSDKEWDDVYFELAWLEKTYNIYLADSPTQVINYQVVSKLQKVTHNHPMLSLDKTKDINEVNAFIGDKDCFAMCKMDGLTCSLRYVNGKLVSAETRGNGSVGEDILHNAKTLHSIPLKIPYIEELIVDGEVICKKDDFIPFSKDYKNPRNFAAGSIRLLDALECNKRNLTFVAWDVIKGLEEMDSLHEALLELETMGFTTVPYILCTGETQKEIDQVKEAANYYKYPIDGVVFKFDSRSYGKTLGKTEHHFKNAIAYKFYDETYLTRVRYIEWTMGRTGILTPVAVFDPVEADGSIIERASLHNISVLQELGLRYQRQDIEVYKANLIIPQVARVYPYPYETASTAGMEIPDVCPICGKPTEVIHTDTSIVLKCTNPLCPGKLINRLDHFCGKKGLDIKGLSKATLNKLIDWNWVSTITDLYSLKEHEQEWMNKPGFGEKSVTNILNAIENSKNCDLWQFISALGIPLIGSTYAKQIAQKIETYTEFRQKIMKHFDFSKWGGFGNEMSNALATFDFSEADKLEQNILMVHNSYWEKENETNDNNNSSLENINIVITGKLIHYKNREALKLDIEKHGGKVVGSVSGKTNYLINNDSKSTSAKNKAAIAAGIPILTEEEFIKKFFDN